MRNPTGTKRLEKSIQRTNRIIVDKEEKRSLFPLRRLIGLWTQVRIRSTSKPGVIRQVRRVTVSAPGALQCLARPWTLGKRQGTRWTWPLLPPDGENPCGPTYNLLGLGHRPPHQKQSWFLEPLSPEVLFPPIDQ